ncbi:MAG: bi-domain-containing oxidoreductase [Chitinophagaceae bacterium]
MKQIVQHLRKGLTLLEEVPAPIIRKGHILIRTHRSLVSIGTERMLVEFSKGSLLSKAWQQPERVRQTVDKIKSDGIIPTLEAVFNKLDEPLPLGYCNAGEVIAVGEDVTEFKIGDRVASNGHHAEVVVIPKNLCARIPDNITYEEASFTVIGAIGLQGIRLTNPSFGETVVVIGLGLIGLITVELLASNGCQVIGFDFDEQKIHIAKSKGIKAYNSSGINIVNLVNEITNGTGADAVIITASAKSNELISHAAQMSRKRGRIILVGVVGLNIQRDDFYKKELSFQVSCSYGPGRYDESYEQKGQDYPLPYIRWTEKRNFEAVLQAISSGKLDVKPLITEKVLLADYQQIYDNINGNSIASVLVYPEQSDKDVFSNIHRVSDRTFSGSKGVIGIIGAGNFTKMTLLPSMKELRPQFKYISSAGGLSAKSLASKYNIPICTTDYVNILKDPEVDLVMITTRHNLHARMCVEALTAGKHVFVEKPLAINSSELDLIIGAYSSLTAPGIIMVGFNRRFSPLIEKAKMLLGNVDEPINIIATMNAGFIPPEVWVQDMNIGGGRIIGEACHYIDLFAYLTGSKVTGALMNSLGKHPSSNTDNAVINLKYANGSQGVINYFSNGSKSYSKERIEIYDRGRTLVLDNFRSLKGYGFKGFSSMQKRQDKGHKAQFERLIKVIREGGKELISFDQLVNTSRATIAAVESLRSGQWEKLIS